MSSQYIYDYGPKHQMPLLRLISFEKRSWNLPLYILPSSITSRESCISIALCNSNLLILPVTTNYDYYLIQNIVIFLNAFLTSMKQSATQFLQSVSFLNQTFGHIFGLHLIISIRPDQIPKQLISSHQYIRIIFWAVRFLSSIPLK